jgi:hypothetical protein
MARQWIREARNSSANAQTNPASEERLRMDLTLHPTRFPVSLEKWYIDTLLDDGSVLLVYLGSLTFCYVRLARVTAELYPPHGPVVRGSATARHIVGRENALRFGPATIAGDHLRFTTSGLSGELLMRPRWPPFALREPFVTEGSRTLHWSVEIPDADVTGTVQWPGGMRAIAGRGYRDRVWFDLPLWRFPIRELRWGRAAAGDHVATWVRATTTQEIVAVSWVDGHMVETDTASGLPVGVTLGPARIFLDADVASLESLRLGGLGGVLRRMSGDLHETKWQATCTIAGVQGEAVHEVVRWRA